MPLRAMGLSGTSRLRKQPPTAPPRPCPSPRWRPRIPALQGMRWGRLAKALVQTQVEAWVPSLKRGSVAPSASRRAPSAGILGSRGRHGSGRQRHGPHARVPQRRGHHGRGRLSRARQGLAPRSRRGLLGPQSRPRCLPRRQQGRQHPRGEHQSVQRLHRQPQRRGGGRGPSRSLRRSPRSATQQDRPRSVRRPPMTPRLVPEVPRRPRVRPAVTLVRSAAQKLAARRPGRGAMSVRIAVPVWTLLHREPVGPGSRPIQPRGPRRPRRRRLRGPARPWRPRGSLSASGSTLGRARRRGRQRRPTPLGFRTNGVSPGPGLGYRCSRRLMRWAPQGPRRRPGRDGGQAGRRRRRRPPRPS
jgi:hypothetical protein